MAAGSRLTSACTAWHVVMHAVHAWACDFSSLWPPKATWWFAEKENAGRQPKQFLFGCKSNYKRVSKSARERVSLWCFCDTRMSMYTSRPSADSPLGGLPGLIHCPLVATTDAQPARLASQPVRCRGPTNNRLVASKHTTTKALPSMLGRRVHAPRDRTHRKVSRNVN